VVGTSVKSESLSPAGVVLHNGHRGTCFGFLLVFANKLVDFYTSALLMKVASLLPLKKTKHKDSGALSPTKNGS
jgi:hypothetical protein